MYIYIYICIDGLLDADVASAQVAIQLGQPLCQIISCYMIL